MPPITIAGQTKYVHFHDLMPQEQAAEMERLQNYREVERPIFDEIPLVPDLEFAAMLIDKRQLVLAQPDDALFGIAKPVRNRAILPNTDAEGSIPYLTPQALGVVLDMMSDIKLLARDDELSSVLDEYGYSDFRMSWTSLTRTTHHQRIIAKQGKLAVGADGGDDHSTHETGQTIDLDHTGFYVRKEDGSEISMNPSSDNPEQHARLRPLFKKLLGSIIELYQSEGLILVHDEVPDGWGVFHTAVIPGK